MRPYSIFVLDYVPNESCFKLFYNQFFIFVMFLLLSLISFLIVSV